MQAARGHGQRRPRRASFAIVAVAAVVLTACGVGSDTTPDASTTGRDASGAPTDASSAGPAPSPSPASNAVTTTPSEAVTTAPSASPSERVAAPAPARWDVMASGLSEPVALLVDPRTDEDLVVELGGRVVTLDGIPVLDLSDRVFRGGERGFLDATATPDGDAVVVHYSGNDDGRTVVSRLPVLADGPLADPGDEQVLLEFAQPASNHNGGSVVFGDDGMLYVALGDGGRGNDAFGHGADPGTPLGAILRLDVTSQPGEVVVPADNPFATGGGDPRVWAHGLRNPWRIATDGDAWYVADVGQDAVEEVSEVPAGAGPHDLGWPAWEGDLCRIDVCRPQSIPPVATLTHADGACSIIGMAVAARPAVDDGAAFWTDLCDTRTWRLEASGEVVEDVTLPGAAALALDVDAQGHVVALTTDGQVLRRTRG